MGMLLFVTVVSLVLTKICFVVGELHRKEFDMSRYSQRYIALKIAFVGWDYQGFALQKHTDNTIENHLFAALKKTCLISPNSTATWDTDRDACDSGNDDNGADKRSSGQSDFRGCGYTRGARTDKGVSAAGLVVSVRARSTVLCGRGVVSTPVAGLHHNIS